LHDVRADDWRDHREVGAGIIDFQRLFDALKRLSYEGLFAFELEEPEKEAALARSRARILDIIANA
jgi:sugar phosphate isomerase/epimerase